MRLQLKSFTTAGLVLVALALPGAAAGADPIQDDSAPPMKMLRLESGLAVPADGRFRSKAQEQAFSDAVSQAYAQGASDAELRDDFGLVNVSDAPASPKPQSALPSAAHQQAAAAALDEPTKAEPDDPSRGCTTGGVRTNGTNPDKFFVGAPQFYKAQGPGNPGFVVIAKWRWNDGADPTAGVSTCFANVGGRDGVGLTLSRNVTRLSQSLSICPYNVKCHAAGSMADNNARGAAFMFQDQASSVGSNSTSGSIAVSFRYLQPAKCHQAFAKYWHTWQETAVTGIGVGPYSLSVEWNSHDERWTRAGNAGNNGKC
ncbi:hypothetical protein [Nocardioides lijunqiniae]|uniref:hypothetical protein n=1 Tax=Nocardioides lijunqiniae TaxID=2760832 RepID=UPI001878EA2D|nr:hypothetical protein [Nocardioides lijunqiniae]